MTEKRPRKAPIPPRLFVIFAKEANEAVIFRRKPTDWYHILRWNTERDEFHAGGWIKGRIYPERCDLSPDGELLLYFVLQPKMRNTEYQDSWNAISRLPWLDPLGLWPQGSAWNGGGRFTGNRSAILRWDPIVPLPQHPGHGLSVSFDGYRSRLPGHASVNEVSEAEWSGRDQAGRLIYAQDGKLMCRLGVGSDICLADFNHYRPNPQPSPECARRSLI